MSNSCVQRHVDADPAALWSAEPRKTRSNWRQPGFTLIELIICVAVLSIAVAGVLGALNLNVARSADPMIRKNMQSIAEALLEEVELMPFTYCDPSQSVDPSQTWATATSTATCAQAQGIGANGETRISLTNPFNNVGDYAINATTSLSGAAATVGLGNSTTAILDISGNNTAPIGYTAVIGLTPESLGPASAAISSSTGAAGMNVLRITVTVTHGSNSVTLEGYRARYWPNNLPW
jgi:MSHA pilin protein MshD